MKKKIPFLILVTIILIFSGAYIYAFHSTRYNVKEIQISGNSKITADDIMKKVESYRGKNILNLDLKRIEEKLKEDVRLRQVRIKKILPGSILIEVEEKTPVLWINLPASIIKPSEYGFYGLTVDQEIIPLDKNDLSRDLPIVSGFETRLANERSVGPIEPFQRWNNFELTQALEFYSMLMKNDSISTEFLAEINLSDAPNLILYLLPYGNKVMIGHDDFERKWKRVKTILYAEKKVEELVCLDLRFNDQVVLTRSAKKDTSSEADSSHSGNKKGKNSMKSRG